MLDKLDKLDRTTRLRLLRIVAAAAWVDGEVQDAERAFVKKLLDRLSVPDDERKAALGYLDSPPHPAEVDPNKLPHDVRETLVSLVKELVASDATTTDEERETVQHLEELLLG
jgi:uncharacterized tellurite resistance protein B-like protein